VVTTTQLAAADGPHVPHLNDETLGKLQRQAHLQVASRDQAVPRYELLTPHQTDGPRGLFLLPPASAADVFFDIEGFSLIDDGREYLFCACFHEGNESAFRDWWAHSPAEEKRAFESFVLWAHGRWREHPDLHIYHYNHYEVTALRRLMGKYGVCEREGAGDVASAGESMVFYQRWLIAQDGHTPQESAILKQIRDYNEQDCLSTAELAAWLWQRQTEAGIVPAPRAAENPDVEVDGQTDNVRRHMLVQEILAEIPDERPSGEPGERLRVKELLAHLLEFHRREEKPVWWRRFDRMEMQENELIDDPECLGGMQRTVRPPERIKQSLAYEYTHLTVGRKQRSEPKTNAYSRTTGRSMRLLPNWTWTQDEQS